MNSKQKSNLMLVISKLRSIPPNRFDFGVFVGIDWRGMRDLSCGTRACALGWATTIPELQKQGFELVYNSTEYLEEASPVCRDLIIRTPGGEISPWESVEASCEKLFGLKPHETQSLFSPFCHSCPLGTRASADDVADQIEQFLKEKVIDESSEEATG